MAVLKKGSKGKEVQALQTRLNRLGAKPQLKIDGIFGPNTHKAVVAFQKKAKLKSTNGAVDNLTVAALQYGGPLPTMNVKDLSSVAKLCKDFQRHNLLLIGFMSALDAATGNLDKTIDKTLPTATKMAGANKSIWESIIKISQDVVSKQKQFDSLLLSHPHRAKKLADECDTLFKQVQSQGEAASKNVDTVYSTLDKTISDLSKNVAEVQKMMADLKKHSKKSQKFI
ncbi:peptidoglycan-binding protein [Ruegeria sp. R13_0]|uniref:peptidoglycan-binding domain-containing protein n=1 Tax=Ruegeria sp. R13_0 TaxID=2821099 RepID=UPI001ADBF6EF|nr:peptidoglycan-binding protein [Ruegeria sp. R13_0]MBO9436392.1 peptidoglycan-binding protein [Ruegeria sp. R13_0]